VIQRTVREQFARSTVITIAHRINTIIDYDRVMVLSQGRLSEFDSPANLLRDPKSLFSQLVDTTGEESAAALREIAFAKARDSEPGSATDDTEVPAAVTPVEGS